MQRAVDIPDSALREFDLAATNREIYVRANVVAGTAR